MGKTVIVLGMHRSGTSMIAGVLHRLGVDMGNELLAESPSNPLGHFEDLDFLDLNEKILLTAGGSWSNPPAKEIMIIQKKRFESRIKSLINKPGKELWGWKDPRTSLTIWSYVDYLSNPYFIVCHRNIEDVAVSLKKRNNNDNGKELKSIYEEFIEDFFQKYSKFPRLDINYEMVLKNPHGWVEKIADFLGIKVSKKDFRKAVDFILPNKIVHRISRKRFQEGNNKGLVNDIGIENMIILIIWFFVTLIKNH